jgi:hypothetical protein
MAYVFIVTDENKPKICAAIMEADFGKVVEIKDPTRNLEQNALLWPLLEAVSKQVNWYGQKLTTWEWKDVFSAALKKQKAVPGIEGGFVVCGQSTSKMSKKDFSELIELIMAFGAQHNVNFGLPTSPTS